MLWYMNYFTYYLKIALFSSIFLCLPWTGSEDSHMVCSAPLGKHIRAASVGGGPAPGSQNSRAARPCTIGLTRNALIMVIKNNWFCRPPNVLPGILLIQFKIAGLIFDDLYPIFSET